MSERLTDEQLAAIRTHVEAFDELGNVSVDELPYPPPQHVVAELNVRAYRLANDAPRLLAHIDTLTAERNALVDVIMHHTDICVFGGGHVRNGVARRDSCKYGHPGCACADWMATRGLDDEASA